MMGKILTAYIFLAARLREPSSQAALSAVFLSVGMQYDAGTVHNWLTTLGLGFGVMGIFVKESKPETVIKWNHGYLLPSCFRDVQQIMTVA